MKDKVIAFMAAHGLTSPGDIVTVALSGGADSVALLRVLLETAEQTGVDLRACHVNHCLRGSESDGDEAFCRALCESLGVPLTVRRCDVPAYCASHSGSLEENARLLRYRALEEAAAGSLIATAHHLGDNAETVLLNLARGTALDGLCGIPPRRGSIIRPLLGVTREEILSYLRSLGQTWREDSTNLVDDAARNRLRHVVVPALTALNPSFPETVGAMTESLRADRAFLDSLTDRWYGENAKDGGLPRASCAALPEALRLRVLRRLLRESGAGVDRRRLQACDSLLAKGKGARPVGKDLVFRVEEEFCRVVSIRKEPALEMLELDIAALPERIPLLPGKVLLIRRLSLKERKLFVNKRHRQYQNVIDCDTIKHPLFLRSRREGDRLRPVGRGCTKTLKKLFSEKKIPPGLRDAAAVLESGGEVLWAEGFGVRESSALTPSTRDAVLLTVVNEEMSP